MRNPTVIVAGAGPVGLATAYGLAKEGVDVLVLDQEETVSTAPRAMAYLFIVHDGFERLGILSDLQAEGLRGDGMNLIDHATGEHFHSTLDAITDDVRHPYTLHLGQGQVSRVLLRHLATLENAEVRYATEVTGVTQDESGVTVQVSGPDGPQTVRGDWLVGADGANSAVRQTLGLGFDGITWPDRFVSTNIRADLGAQGLKIANWRIDPHYGAIIAKITADDLWRFTFRESAELPLDGLEERIHEHFATGMPGGAAYELVQFAPYRMHQRAADTFRLGRVLLAGDAAHITNPVGGLGLTGGFLDSFVLTEALAAVIHGTADEAVLDRYAEERRRVFLEVASPAATANKRMLFDAHSPQEKAQLLGGLRHMATDREFRRSDLLAMRGLITPSLLDAAEAVR
ncbi:FAD-dependent monooxygenase [Nocardioides sp.]|uniref:FAD-dependent oxidoreductase n=1 Tax=Nocardioides sp. TaxID=35761 RepID=UPI002638E86E|nr:FAD-dependent monooxygenase [Nocardioides sp.]